MEAFANARGVRTAWSSEVGEWKCDGSRMAITAIVLENHTPALRKLRGVQVELANAKDHDLIYLDEQALERTRTALRAISDMAGPSGIPGEHSCMGAMQFTDKYEWPWNKYHELNVNFCGGKETVALYLEGRGRGKPFAFAGKKPDDLGEILAVAMDQLKQH